MRRDSKYTWSLHKVMYFGDQCVGRSLVAQYGLLRSAIGSISRWRFMSLNVSDSAIAKDPLFELEISHDTVYSSLDCSIYNHLVVRGCSWVLLWHGAGRQWCLLTGRHRAQTKSSSNHMLMMFLGASATSA